MQKHSFQAIGTHWSIETADPLPVAAWREISGRIEQFDRTYSRFRRDSLASKLRTPGDYIFPTDATVLMTFYRQLYRATEGAVTPLVGEVLERAGYDSEYSLVSQKQSSRGVPAWQDAMRWQGNRVTVMRPIVFDVGAAGKGYLVDIVAQILTSHNIESFVVDASGDICHRGPSAERVGLENPHDTAQVLGVATLQNASLCASATNRRAWADWHHIIDPRTARPTHEVVATWVVADSTMIADGLATALFFVGFEALTDWQFTAVRLLADGRLEYTPDFVGELYI